MKKLITVLLGYAFVVLFCAAPALAEPKHTSIAAIEFNNDATYDGAVPAEMKPVTEAIAKVYPDATFGVEKQTLGGVEKEVMLVGLRIEGADKGRIAKITWTSNCSVNTIYSVEAAQVVGIYKVLGPTAIAFCRVEHIPQGLQNAKVQKYDEKPNRIEVVLEQLAKN